MLFYGPRLNDQWQTPVQLVLEWIRSLFSDRPNLQSVIDLEIVTTPSAPCVDYIPEAHNAGSSQYGPSPTIYPANARCRQRHNSHHTFHDQDSNSPASTVPALPTIMSSAPCSSALYMTLAGTLLESLPRKTSAFEVDGTNAARGFKNSHTLPPQSDLGVCIYNSCPPSFESNGVKA